MPAPRFHPFSRLILCALGLIGVSVLLGLMLYAGSALATMWSGRPPEEQLLDLATRFALPLTVLSYPANLLWIGLCRRRFDGRSFVSLGLRARRAGADMVRGIATGALSITLLWLILWLTGIISVVGWSPAAWENGLWVSALALSGYALAFFAVGFFEETLFRGYVLHNLHAWLGWRGAVAIQAMLFAVVHLGNVVGADPEARQAALGALPSLFLIAVFFALCVRKTGGLWFPIGFHFAWNFCLGCVFSLPVSGIETFKLLDVQSSETSWFSGGSFGAEGSFFLIPILLALIYYISKAPDHPQTLLDLELLLRADAVVAPEISMPEEPEEEARENRYGTKFGTSQGFSADTLRELRELQEERERSQAEARETARREALAQQLASPTIGAPQTSTLQTSTLEPIFTPEVTPIAATRVDFEVSAEESQKAAEVEIPEPNEPKTPAIQIDSLPTPRTETLAPDAATDAAPISPAPIKPKPPAPRW